MSDPHPTDPGDGTTGKPPKSADRIRQALESVHGQIGAEPAGQARGGLKPDAQLVVASFHDADLARSYQQALSQAGVLSSRRRAGRMTEVRVDYEDRQRAHEVLSVHRGEHPDRAPRGVRRDFDYLIFGVIIGGSASLVPLFGVVRRASDVTVIVAFILTGAVFGHLVDRLRGGLRRHRRIRIGVWELLLLTAAVLLVVGLVVMVPRLIHR